MKLGAFQLSGSIQPTDFLWTASSSTSLALQAGTTQLTVTDDAWNKSGVGDVITEKMRAHSAGYIAELPALHVAT